MVDEEYDVLEEGELVEEPEDTAKALTTGLVIGTTIVLVLAFVVMEMALAEYFDIGPFASK